MIEIRFDAIETVFSVDRITYINNLITWVKTYIDKEATGIDLTEVVEEIRLNGEKDGVIVSEQHMEMASGSEATVSIGKNEARQLPFISEIKSIMEIYSKELESVPELKKALDDFLYEKDKKQKEESKKSNKIVVGDLELDLEKIEVRVKGEVKALTPKEFELVKYLAMQPGVPVTREVLLEKVWNYEYYGDIRTVDVTVCRIREKLGDSTKNSKIIINKRGIGYYLASK